MSLALLAMVVGTRPAVTLAMVRAHLVEYFGVTEDHATVHRMRPDDYIAALPFLRISSLCWAPHIRSGIHSPFTAGGRAD